MMQITNKNSQVWFFTIIGFVIIGAFLLMVWITPLGSGVSPDSTAYFNAAEVIMPVNGFPSSDRLITNFPPLYPFVLGLVNLLFKNMVETARFLNAALFALNIGLVTWLVYTATGRNVAAAVCAILFFISSSALIEVHAWAWSEPLFIALLLLCLLLLIKSITQPSTVLFIASAIFMGLALLTRYAGIGFFPAAVMVLFLFYMGGVWRRVRYLLIWSVIAIAPLGLWLIRNMLEVGKATNRDLVYHPVSIAHVNTLFTMLMNFLAPVDLSLERKLWIFGLLILILVILLMIPSNQHIKAINSRSLSFIMATACFSFILSYTIFIFISISFFDASTPIDTRIFSPLLVILIPGGGSLVWTLSEARKKPLAWWFFLLVCVSLVIIRTPGTLQTAQMIEMNGLGYTEKQWVNSETIRYTQSFLKDRKIYTNGPDVLSFMTENQILYLPRKYSSLSTEVNPTYLQEMSAMCADIKENKAVLVYLDKITWRIYFPTRIEIESACEIRPVRQFMDGSVYQAKQVP